MEYIVMYEASDKRIRFARGMLLLDYIDDGEYYTDKVLSYMTGFVKSKWKRIEMGCLHYDHFNRLTGNYNNFLIAEHE